MIKVSFARLFHYILILVIVSVYFSQPDTNTHASSSLDAPSRIWQLTAEMNAIRAYHTLSILSDGKVLAAGGYNGTNYLNSCEIYDPVMMNWSETSSMSTQRSEHSATPLLDGRILVIGGKNGVGYLKKAEIYDPLTGSWSSVDDMTDARAGHTATRLNDGRVFVVGGCYGSVQCNNSAEIFNPATGIWTLFDTPFQEGARTQHTATLLANGKILVAGGWNGVSASNPSNYHNTAYLFDPATDSWSKAASMSYRRRGHAAVLRRDGTVLVAGGHRYVSGTGDDFLSVNEYYNPGTNTWTNETDGGLLVGRRGAPAILDPFGSYAIHGGISKILAYETYYESRDINTDSTWSMDHFFVYRRFHAVVQLTDGTFLSSGGYDQNSGTYLKTANLFKQTQGASNVYSGIVNEISAHAAAVTLDAQGNVVITGGTNDLTNCSKSVYLWRSSFDDRDNLPPMNLGRCLHTATLLPDGRILVIGGSSSISGSIRPSIEIYDGSNWNQTNISYEFAGHQSVLLANGKVLIIPPGSFSAYLLDPLDLSIRKTTGDMNAKHDSHTATMMRGGRVLIVGTITGSITAEIFNPADETFTNASPTTTPFNAHTSTLMPDGKVLIAGGRSGGLATNTVYRYTPSTNQWHTLGDLKEARYNHSAVLLPDGRVTVVGGKGKEPTKPFLTSIEIYQPNYNVWDQYGDLINARANHASILTPQGSLFTVGGINGTVANPTIATQPERFYFYHTPFPNTPSYSNYRRPAVTSASFSSEKQLSLNGSGFLGPEEASGGLTNQSPTNQPIVQAIRLDNQQMIWFHPGINSSNSSFKSKEYPDLPQGAYLLFAYTNGAFSNGKIVFLSGYNHKGFLPILMK